MNISAPFIKRPIGTFLLALGLAVSGLIAFQLLPVSPLPQIEFPTISIQASLPGASAEIMASSVATPLETTLSRIAGVTEMTSASSLGSTRITLQFDLSRDVDGAARDVQAAINAASSQLPSNLPTNPTYRKVNPADAPVLILSLTSDKYSTGEMYDVATNILQQKLSQIQGIGQVIVGGSSLPAVRVEVNPFALNHYAIALPDVATFLNSANANTATGQIDNGNATFEIATNDQLFKAKDYLPLIIAYRNNQPVVLSDVAKVVDSVQDLHNAGFSNGKPAVIIILFKQPGANVITTIDSVHRILPFLKASISKEINVDIMMDRTTTIRASLHDVELTLLIAMVLVVLVTYLFLGSLRAMIIPGIVVPLSLIGTFAVMYVAGYSLDNLSLMALTIATGFVVDDAVVVLENITRHLEIESSTLKAAFIGAKEVGFTVVSMTTSMIAVFIPILFMGGIVGRLFREFAVTLSVAIVISMFISLTVTPMMCALLLKREIEQNCFSKNVNKIRNYYKTTLQWSLQHSNLMLMITIFMIISNVFLFIFIPKGFFPQQDTGRLIGLIQAQQNISFQAMRSKLLEYVNVIKNDSAVQNVVGFVGNGSVNTGSVFVSLKDLNIRKISADSIINNLRRKLTRVPGAALYLQSAQDLNIGGRQGGAQFQYTLSANSLAELNQWVPQVFAKLSTLKKIADVNSDQRNNGLQVFVNVNHDTAARYGLTSEQIDNALYNAYGQSIVSTIFLPLNQYRVVMEVDPVYSQYPAVLDLFRVITTTGLDVPLSSFATMQNTATLLSVNHQGQTPSATFSFNLMPKAALGDAVNLVGSTVAKLNLPASVYGSFNGTALAFQQSLSNQIYLIIGAILAVYIVLGMLYESLLHPLTILSTLPSAGVGALLALLLMQMDFSIIALIGLVLLIGIVKKNAIMMIDFALHLQREEKKSSSEAIYQAALLRFRPIMMTTMAALFGALPLILSFGLGSELRRPLGVTIVGGLLVSQLLTLYTTPVIYLSLERWRVWWQKKMIWPFMKTSEL